MCRRTPDDRPAFTDASIDRQKAERIATEIFDAIHDNVATKQDLQHTEAALKAEITAVRAELKAEISPLEQQMQLRFAELEHRLTVRFASVMVVLTGIVLAAIRYLPHG